MITDENYTPLNSKHYKNMSEILLEKLTKREWRLVKAFVLTCHLNASIAEKQKVLIEFAIDLVIHLCPNE